MRSLFLPKCQPKITKISALPSKKNSWAEILVIFGWHFGRNIHSEFNWPLEGRVEILQIFGWHFGRNDDLINSFWILLTIKSRIIGVIITYYCAS